MDVVAQAYMRDKAIKENTTLGYSLGVNSWFSFLCLSEKNGDESNNNWIWQGICCLVSIRISFQACFLFTCCIETTPNKTHALYCTTGKHINWTNCKDPSSLDLVTCFGIPSFEQFPPHYAASSDVHSMQPLGPEWRLIGLPSQQINGIFDTVDTCMWAFE